MRRAVFDAYQDGKHSLQFMLIRYARPALTLTRIRLGGRSANRNRVQCDCFNTYRGMEPGDEQPTDHCSLRYWRLRASLARRAGAKPWLNGSFLALLQVSGIAATRWIFDSRDSIRCTTSPVTCVRIGGIETTRSHSLQSRLSFSVTRKVACVRHRTAAPVRQAQALQKEQALVAASST